MFHFQRMLKQGPVIASAPCRIDFGGTLDIRTFHYPLRPYHPCTFNVAIGMRTRVVLLPGTEGEIRVESKGFDPAVFPVRGANLKHPLGLFAAIALFWGMDGILIRIESASPPRSGLGGSSAAAVAVMAACAKAAEANGKGTYSPREIVSLAHAVEESVAGVPCGLQDQLAAAYGGVNLWNWQDGVCTTAFRRQVMLPVRKAVRLTKHLALAYCGIPHESKSVNQTWIQQFLEGRFHREWIEIIQLTRQFGSAVAIGDIAAAVTLMRRELDIRMDMTPDVLDDVGRKLVATAEKANCGARFTGAGAGGCIWAYGRETDIETLRRTWEEMLADVPEGRLLPVDIDVQGLHCTRLQSSSNGT